MNENKKTGQECKEPEKFAKPEKYDLGFWISVYFWFLLTACAAAGVYALVYFIYIK